LDEPETVQASPLIAAEDFTRSSGLNFVLPFARVNSEKAKVRIKISKKEEKFTWQWIVHWLELQFASKMLFF
jgi:hypothetical protein